MTIESETIEETRKRCEKHGAKWLGDRIEFAVTGLFVPRRDALKVFQEHGFASLVERPPKPDSALKAASRRGRNPKGYLVREFVHPNPDTPMAIHVTEVTGDDESGDEYTCLARVRIGNLGLDADGDTIVQARAFPPEGQNQFPDEEARKRAEDIAEQANSLLENMDASQMGKALRAAVEQAGGSKSLGGGNNYYIIHHNAPTVHAFMDECKRRLGIYYLRDPKTTMGARHDVAVMQDAGKRKLTEELLDMRERLVREIEEAEHPTLTAKGKPKSREGYIKRQLESMQTLGNKLSMYKEVIEASVLTPLQETQELYQRHFRSLLQGDVINFLDEDPLVTEDKEPEELPDGLPEPSAPPASEAPPPPPSLEELPAISVPPSGPVGQGAEPDHGTLDDEDDLFGWTETA